LKERKEERMLCLMILLSVIQPAHADGGGTAVENKQKPRTIAAIYQDKFSVRIHVYPSIDPDRKQVQLISADTNLK
jgi:hypothetical protein